jgi:hypothetical protein
MRCVVVEVKYSRWLLPVAANVELFRSGGQALADQDLVASSQSMLSGWNVLAEYSS